MFQGKTSRQRKIRQSIEMANRSTMACADKRWWNQVGGMKGGSHGT